MSSENQQHDTIKGVKMGLEAQYDKNIYEHPSSNKSLYDSEIQPIEEEQDDDIILSSDTKNGPNALAPYTIPHDDFDKEDELSKNENNKQIKSRMNSYQQKYFDYASYTPARIDPFSTPAMQESQKKLELQQQQQQHEQSSLHSEKHKQIREFAQKEIKTEARSYKDIMHERALEKEKKELAIMMKNQIDDGKQKKDNDDHDNYNGAKVGDKRRWDKEEAANEDGDETPATKKSRWDKAGGNGALTPANAEWASTPAVIQAITTPGLGWGQTPGATTPGIGGMTPAGIATPSAMTPSAITPSARTPAQKGSRTPGLGYEVGSRTPGLGYTPTQHNRWDSTPGAATPFGTTPFGATPALTPKGSRWDATPDARGGKTPMGDISKFHGTPAPTPGLSMLGGIHGTPAPTPSGMTGGIGTIALQTPTTPEQYHNYRIQMEIDVRNRMLTDEDIEEMLEGVKGYEIVEPPINYTAKTTPLRARLLSATPTPFQQQDGFIMPSTPEQQSQNMAVAALSGYEVPNDPTLPTIKPDDYQFFKDLIDKKDDEVDDLMEIKKRTILKLILKVKNGTPPQRKSALRQLSDNARDLGAAALFDTVLPLLMSPVLEDQERHLLVKVIDRILYKLDDQVRPYVHKILVVIEPLLIDEDYYARVEGREIIANLSKAAGLAHMISTMRPDIDHMDEYVRNTTARAFSVVASALGIPVLLPFLQAVCQSQKSWEARHTGIKIIQQIAILMGCAVLPHLRKLVEIIEKGLEDEESKVRTITALALAALAEASAPYGIEAFDTVLRPLWHGISNHRGKTRAAFLKAIGYIIPLMDADYASYYTREVMPQLIQEFGSPDEEMKKIVLKVVKQCVSTEGVEASYIINDILPDFFRHFWHHQMAIDRRNYRQLVETTTEIAKKVGGAQIISRIVDDLRHENETYRKMVMETIDKVIEDMGIADIDQKLEEQLIDGILYAFQEQTADDSSVILAGFGTTLNALNIRTQPYLAQICGIIKWRLNNASPRIRQQAADLIARIASVIKVCNEMKLLKHLGKVLFELLGEEYPDVLGSILSGLKAVVNVIGMEDMQPPIKDLLPRLTPIMKNRHEKVQENCIDLVGRIADRGFEHVSPNEWMRIGYELLDMLKAHKKGIRRAAVNTFGYIAKAVGPQEVLEILLNNLRVQERQNRVCTTVAIAIVAETCGPFTILPALMNEYRVPELNVQNGVLKSLSFLFEYIGEASREYVYPVTTLLTDALVDRDLVHRQTACAVVKHMSLGVIGMGCEDALQHLLNHVWPNIFETSPHLVQAFTEAIDGLRVSLGSGILLQYLLQGLFHPARKVRNVYWRLYNNLYIGSQDALVTFYPTFEQNLSQNGSNYRREEMLYFV